MANNNTSLHLATTARTPSSPGVSPVKLVPVTRPAPAIMRNQLALMSTRDVENCYSGVTEAEAKRIKGWISSLPTFSGKKEENVLNFIQVIKAAKLNHGWNERMYDLYYETNYERRRHDG